MVVTDCSVATGDGRHKASITAATIPVIGPNVGVVGVSLEVCLYDVDGCVLSSVNIGLSILVCTSHVPFLSSSTSRVLSRLCSSEYKPGWSHML